MGIANNSMHSGSSGGPWIGKYEGRQEYVSGVNSHHHGGDDDPKEHTPCFNSKFNPDMMVL